MVITVRDGNSVGFRVCRSPSPKKTDYLFRWCRFSQKPRNPVKKKLIIIKLCRCGVCQSRDAQISSSHGAMAHNTLSDPRGRKLFKKNKKVTGFKKKEKQYTSFAAVTRTLFFLLFCLSLAETCKARHASACDARPPSIGSRAVVPRVACHGSGRGFKTALPLCRGATSKKISQRPRRRMPHSWEFFVRASPSFLPPPIQNTLGGFACFRSRVVTPCLLASGPAKSRLHSLSA